MNNTPHSVDSLPLCPQLCVPPPSTTSDWGSAARRCWTCSVLCCCFPACYPCYLSKTARKRRKIGKKKPMNNSQTKKRSEKGHKAYKKSQPVETGQARVTSTMTSEQSTGTSGNGTLLSRKGTLHSVLPNVQPNEIQETFLNKVDNLRKEINTIFISTDAATKFLRLFQLSELLQAVEVSENQKHEFHDIL